MTDTTIESLRERIDDLDGRIVALLSERAACAIAIGRIKDASGQAVYQPGREAEVLTHVRSLNHGPLDDAALTRLFERIIDEARRLERQAHTVADGPSDGATGQ
jgi:chorismate mutase